MINQKKTANAIGGKTARACESCLKNRAKWFCTADDAFLCQACDSVVHSANELASRHTRVCLDTNPTAKPPPSWHQGFTKKARTPRNNSKSTIKYSSSQMPVVPEVGNDEEDDQDEGLLLLEQNNNHNQESSDQIIFSVPNLEDDYNGGVNFKGGGFEEEDINCIANSEFNVSLIGFDGDNHGWDDVDANYLPVVGFPDNELAEFAADVESLLQQDGEEVAAKKGELLVHRHQHVCYSGVKVEEEGDIISTTTTTTHDDDHCCYLDWSIDVESEMFNFDLNNHSNNNFNDSWGGYDQSQGSGVSVEEDESEIGKQMVVPKKEDNYNELNTNNNNKERRIVLRLNYEEVINAWANQGCSSPWITGHRPEFEFDHHGWPNCMDKYWQGDGYPSRGVDHVGGEEWIGGRVKGEDGGRKARVRRYKEKRRTRLFTKKIRYEVRKLNAEKRPRLKGRFVKRTSLSQASGSIGVQSSFPYLNG